MMEHQTTNLFSTPFTALVFLFLVMGFSSCYYDNVEDLYPEKPACDTINVSYSATVVPIMEAYCYNCHSAASPTSGIIFDNYDDLKMLVDDNRFSGAINHLEGYTPMPLDGEKLSDCTLSKINAWINAGAPNN